MLGKRYNRIDYYKQFGLEDFSSIDKVKDSYRRLVLKHHPDRGGSEEKMKIINRIYEILTKEKEMYDNFLRIMKQPMFNPNQNFRIIINYNWGYGSNNSTTSGTWWAQ